MAAPTVIKWTDPGAPALTRTAGSLIRVLDYCLPQRGWVKTFTGTNKAVYRAASGTERKFYHFQNDAAFRSSFALAGVKAYDSMSDVDTGAGLWCSGGAIQISQNAADTIIRPWICIVGEKGFWFLVSPYSTTDTLNTYSSAQYYFGETIPMLPGKTARSVCSAGVPSDDGSCQANDLYFYYPNNRYSRICRDLNAAGVGVLFRGWPDMYYRAGGDAGYPLLRSDIVPRSMDYPYNGGLTKCHGVVVDDNNALGDHIPGYAFPVHNGQCFTQWQVIDDSYLICKTCNYTSWEYSSQGLYYGVMMIDISEDA